MKRRITVLFTLLTIVLTCTAAYAKPKARGFGGFYGKKPMTLQGGLQAIAPKNTTPAAIDAQVAAAAVTVKKANDSYSDVAKQAMTKKLNVEKLINQLRRGHKTLTNDQYTSVNNKLVDIKTESSKITAVKNLNAALNLANGKAARRFQAVDLTAQQLNDMAAAINANLVHLKNISTDYDSILAVLNTAVSTTPAAITTLPAINQ